MGREVTIEESKMIDDVFSLGEHSQSALAESLYLNDSLSYRYELTINYPRTIYFKKMLPEWQRELYKNLILYVKLRFPIEVYQQRFETCKDGHVHVHAIIYSGEDILNEVAECILSQIPRGCARNRFKKVNGDRYECPALCFQRYPHLWVKRGIYWERYINKNQ